MKLKEVYTLDEVAKALKVGRRSVYNFRAQGRIKTIRIGGTYRVSREDLESILENGLPSGSTPEYREYFRSYRKRKKAEGAPDADGGVSPVKGSPSAK